MNLIAELKRRNVVRIHADDPSSPEREISS